MQMKSIFTIYPRIRCDANRIYF